ncbi:MAG: adenosine deaminase [Chloroflexi bacterium]|nr:adenosine deaminase [Chloroflexota bacterium]
MPRTHRGLSWQCLALVAVMAVVWLLAPSNARGQAAQVVAPAGPTAEARTAAYFASIRDQPPLLRAFLRAFPKGADLHSHLSGAVYAESYIAHAAAAGLCVDRATWVAGPPPCDPATRPAVADALRDATLYDALVDAWSVRDFVPDPAVRSGRAQFFRTFRLFNAASDVARGDMLAEVVARAAAQNVHYLELMLSPDLGRAARLGALQQWDGDLPRLHAALQAAGMDEIVAFGRAQLDAMEARAREVLGCDTPGADPGCALPVRYLYQVNRVQPPERVFAQMVYGFALVQADPRVVGVNIVAPEDAYVARRDYRLHMAMFAYLRERAPAVNLALHAGELTLGLVPPEDLRFHIREAVERAGARRIGHGVSIMYEDDPFGLLDEMARRGVLVEINLTSNAVILGVEGRQSPFPVYRAAGVPVALSTDDEGVSRIDLTHEYQRAVEQFGLGYADLKTLSRNGLEYSFLPGASLWETPAYARFAAPCHDAVPGAPPPAACQAHLDASEKARVQWHLEEAFARFETAY